MNEKLLVKFLDFILFIFFIIFVSRGSFYFIFSEESRTVLLSIIYIYFLLRICIVYIFKSGKLNWNKSILTVILLIICSSLWSSDIIYSLKLAILQILFPSLVITFFGNNYKLITVLRNTFIPGFIITLSSYFIVLINPSLGIDQGGGDIGLWTGIFNHKNLLSVSICFHFIVSIFLLLIERIKYLRVLYFFISLLELLLLILSGSSTGIVAIGLATLISISLLYLIKIKNMYLLVSLLTFYLIFLSLFIYKLVISIEDIAFSFGKDLTFSGRSLIWEAVIYMISQKPIFGYGYGAFWIEGSYTQNYVSRYIFVQQAHNGFLDIFTSIGWVGFILIMISYIIYIRRNLTLIIVVKDKSYFLPLVFLAFFTIYNLQESFFIEQNFFMWSFYVYFYMFLSSETKRYNR